MGKFTGKVKSEMSGEVEAPVDTSIAAESAPKSAKSIVPGKYAGKYKKGGDDALANFIKDQCTGKDGFEFPAFFLLCEKNGIAEVHTNLFRDALANKVHGAEGRARMTLRNRLAPIVRKNSKLVGLNGEEVEVTLPPLPVREKKDAAPVAEAAE